MQAGARDAAAPAADERAPAVCCAQTLRLALPAGERVLLAVSGGSDSMALLGLARPLLPGRAAVVHVRHRLRAGAERDEALVREACGTLGLPLCAEEAGPSPADPSRTETAARRRRLAALRRACASTGARWILLAHHRDDDLETLLLRLQRGHVGDCALAGIPTVRPLEGGGHLLRPFLVGPSPPGRRELALCRQAAGLPHAEDPSNADERIARNRVRAALARGEPAPIARLLDLRHAARRRLATRLSSLAMTLAQHLHAEGLGARLSPDALPTAADDAALSDLGELLHLLGGCLLHARRFDPRASVLRELQALLRRRSGALSLPARPQPVRVLASSNGLHLPDEPLQPGPGAARALRALLQTSLYL